MSFRTGEPVEKKVFSTKQIEGALGIHNIHNTSETTDKVRGLG